MWRENFLSSDDKTWIVLKHFEDWLTPDQNGFVEQVYFTCWLLRNLLGFVFDVPMRYTSILAQASTWGHYWKISKTISMQVLSLVHFYMMCTFSTWIEIVLVCLGVWILWLVKHFNCRKTEIFHLHEIGCNFYCIMIWSLLFWFIKGMTAILS